MVERIYNALYERVDNKFFSLIVFGVNYAKDRKIKFQRNYYEQSKKTKNILESLTPPPASLATGMVKASLGTRGVPGFSTEPGSSTPYISFIRFTH